MGRFRTRRIVNFLLRRASAIVALASVVIIHQLALRPTVADSELESLASRFSFSRSTLFEMPGVAHKQVRKVHPGFQHFAPSLSFVGASVSLNDLDGDGLPNDSCSVDTRTDLVTCAPVLGSGARYKPFVLNPNPKYYSSSTMAPMGCLIADLNEDGLMDVLTYYWGRTPIAFLRRKNSGEIDKVSLSGREYSNCEILSSSERWYSNAATLADLDGDGHYDLIVGNWLKNGSRALDANATDAEEMPNNLARASNGGGTHILQWHSATTGDAPSVKYIEKAISDDLYVRKGWALALGAADLNGDSRPELYIANDFGPDRLLYNQSSPGNFKFTSLKGKQSIKTPISHVLGYDSFNGMGTDFGDLNGDGVLDIYVSNIAHQSLTQQSHLVWVSTGNAQDMARGIAPYTDKSLDLGLDCSGWAWESRLADFDNDSELEAIQACGFVKGSRPIISDYAAFSGSTDTLRANPRRYPKVKVGDDICGHDANAFFVKSESGRYHNISQQLGLGDPMLTRGIATSDVDGDGDLDFAVANQWGPSYLFTNQSQKNGQFLGLHLMLPAADDPGRAIAHDRLIIRRGHPDRKMTSRPAIGAAVAVSLPTGKTLVAQVDGGNGHSGKRSQDIHLGLGRVPDYTNLSTQITWRDSVGETHKKIIKLRPGWHTIYLGVSEELPQP